MTTITSLHSAGLLDAWFCIYLVYIHHRDNPVPANACAAQLLSMA